MKLCESRGFDTHLEYQSLVDTKTTNFFFSLEGARERGREGGRGVGGFLFLFFL